AWIIGSEALEDVTIGEYLVPKGSSVLMSQWVMHHDPRYFTDPAAFRPERWDNDFAKTLPKYAYFPFGGGPRICIGNTFAMMEAILVLAMMAERFTLEVINQKPIRIRPAVTLRPGEPVMVKIKALQGTPSVAFREV